MRSTLAAVIASLAAHVGLHVTETDVGLTSVLIFVGSRIDGGEVADILPRTATDHFSLLHRRIVLGGIIDVCRVHVVGEVGGGLVESILAPFSHIAAHVEQTPVIRMIVGNNARIEVIVSDIVTALRFEVAQEAAIAVGRVRTAPRIGSKRVAATGSPLPLSFGRQTELMLESIFLAGEPRHADTGSPAGESLSLTPTHTDNRVIVELRVVEIVQDHRLVIGIDEVMSPAESIGIDVHHLMLDEALPTVALTARTVCIETAKIIPLLVELLGRSTEFIRILGISVITIINPPILIIEHGGV